MTWKYKKLGHHHVTISADQFPYKLNFALSGDILVAQFPYKLYFALSGDILVAQFPYKLYFALSGDILVAQFPCRYFTLLSLDCKFACTCNNEVGLHQQFFVLQAEIGKTYAFHVVGFEVHQHLCITGKLHECHGITNHWQHDHLFKLTTKKMS